MNAKRKKNTSIKFLLAAVLLAGVSGGALYYSRPSQERPRPQSEEGQKAPGEDVYSASNGLAQLKITGTKGQWTEGGRTVEVSYKEDRDAVTISGAGIEKVLVRTPEGLRNQDGSMFFSQSELEEMKRREKWDRERREMIRSAESARSAAQAEAGRLLEKSRPQ